MNQNQTQIQTQIQTQNQTQNKNLIETNYDYQIFQDNRTPDIYEIQFKNPSEHLINSLIKTRILIGATASNNYKSLHFKASSIQTFTEFFLYNESNNKVITITMAAKIINNLATQLNYLISFSLQTFLGYNMENIIVINENTFIYLSSEHLIRINPKTQQVLISYPFTSADFFLSPELTKIKSIPSRVHYKTTYFSLAYLIVTILQETKERQETIPETIPETTSETTSETTQNPTTNANIIQTLDSLPIKGTKIYWLLKRCLVEDPKKRTIIYI